MKIYARNALGLLLAATNTSAQTVEIKLVANETLNAIVGYDDMIYFEPYSPSPSEAMVCAEECPCSFPGDTVCGCDAKTVCGGTTDIDLSGGDVLKFIWDASTEGDKYISLSGDSRTRVEFRAQIQDCVSSYQEIIGADIAVSVLDDGLDVAEQQYTLNTEDSFLVLGTCDGCGDICDINIRVQFDPNQAGVLDLKFKTLVFTAGYDNTKVTDGAYTWATNNYMWIREPDGGSIELLDADPAGQVDRNDTDMPITSPTLNPTPNPTSRPTSQPTATSEEIILSDKDKTNPPSSTPNEGSTPTTSPTPNPTDVESSGGSFLAGLHVVALITWVAVFVI